jgi:hypothetical protein
MAVQATAATRAVTAAARARTPEPWVSGMSGCPVMSGEIR